MFDPIWRARPAPNVSTDDCRHIAQADRALLWQAANALVTAGGLSVRLTGWLSRHLLSATGNLDRVGHRVFGSAWNGIEARIRQTSESVLWKAHDVATFGVGARVDQAPKIRLHRLSASASGAMSGLAGLPGLLLDIPVTTALMLRSIAEIAREHGEDVASDDCKRACLEVLARHGPGEADDAEVGYWSARAGLSHLTIAMLIRTAASRLGVTFSEKLLAQAVPIAGAFAGAGLNWTFMRYYQQIARAHFMVRAVERRAGDSEQVRACFDRLVRQARMLRTAERNPSQPAREGTPAMTVSGI
jgi:hypothetical protein